MARTSARRLAGAARCGPQHREQGAWCLAPPGVARAGTRARPGWPVRIVGLRPGGGRRPHRRSSRRDRSMDGIAIAGEGNWGQLRRSSTDSCPATGGRTTCGRTMRGPATHGDFPPMTRPSSCGRCASRRLPAASSGNTSAARFRGTFWRNSQGGSYASGDRRETDARSVEGRIRRFPSLLFCVRVRASRIGITDMPHIVITEWYVAGVTRSHPPSPGAVSPPGPGTDIGPGLRDRPRQCWSHRRSARPQRVLLPGRPGVLVGARSTSWAPGMLERRAVVPARRARWVVARPWQRRAARLCLWSGECWSASSTRETRRMASTGLSVLAATTTVTAPVCGWWMRTA